MGEIGGGRRGRRSARLCSGRAGTSRRSGCASGGRHGGDGLGGSGRCVVHRRRPGPLPRRVRHVQLARASAGPCRLRGPPGLRGAGPAHRPRGPLHPQPADLPCGIQRAAHHGQVRSGEGRGRRPVPLRSPQSRRALPGALDRQRLSDQQPRSGAGRHGAAEEERTSRCDGAIYFLPGFLNAANAGSERAVEPPLLALFADGSWVLEGLKWTGWGTPVAHATGISSASNGIPNQAEGTRIKTPAEAMLSNPGPFFGHRIYRCIQVFVQPPASFGGKRCLKRTGSLYLYE